MAKKKEREYHARLTVYDFKAMSSKERSCFIKWLGMIASEFKREDPNIFNKNFRATFYK